MFNFSSVALISGLVAALCVIVFPLWVLGVPGDPGPPGRASNYVRGWTMGLHVLWIYPLAWALNFASYFVLRGAVSPDAAQRWQNISENIGVLALAAAIIRMLWAIQILRKS